MTPKELATIAEKLAEHLSEKELYRTIGYITHLEARLAKAKEIMHSIVYDKDAHDPQKAALDWLKQFNQDK